MFVGHPVLWLLCFGFGVVLALRGNYLYTQAAYMRALHRNFEAPTSQETLRDAHDRAYGKAFATWGTAFIAAALFGIPFPDGPAMSALGVFLVFLGFGVFGSILWNCID